ncbi:MAG: Hsp70 family protein [Acidimicrobiales bacterium]|nr:Hsp70 family protein [Acidimicrobiales bacterium]
MAYYLGIDIGTTYTAAAVWRDGRNEIASLGNRAPTIPSVVLLRDDEAVLTGEAAARRAATEPGRVAREFKRRVGDPTPIIVGGTPYSADALMAKLLRWVVDHVSSVEGGPPAGVAVSHPANWGNYKLDLLRQAISLADLDDVATLTEPEAAAIHYASQARVEPGSVIAVYDLGGGTFDAAVLRKTGAGWEILGAPEGIERLGGVDFDEAVFHHVARAIGGALDELDPDDATAQAAVARLRQECIDAKEALSSDSDVSIPIMLPNLQTEVRLTRGEYEQMVRPALADTITAMNRALRSANVTPDQVTAVLLVGGSSRTPLVAELVSTALGRPVAVDAHPKYGVAMGAAITAATRGGQVGAVSDAATSSPPPVAPPSAATGDAAPGRSPSGPAAAAAGAGAAAGYVAGRHTSAADAGGGPPPTEAAPVTARHDAGAPPPAGPGGRDPRSVTVPYGESSRADRAAATRSAAGAPRDHGPLAGGGRGDGPRHGGTAGGGGSRRPLLVALGALIALALVGGGAVMALGDDSPTGTTTPDTTDDTTGTTGEDPTTTVPQTTSTLPPGPFVQIDEVQLDDGQYRVDYQVSGFTPQRDGGPDALHIHFFPDTTEPQNAGNNGNPPGDWDLTDDPSSYRTKYTPDMVAGASQMCAVVATNAHEVYMQGTTTGNCVDLPG